MSARCCLASRAASSDSAACACCRSRASLVRIAAVVGLLLIQLIAPIEFSDAYKKGRNVAALW